MRFLLIIATLGRDSAVDALLASLAAQTHAGSRVVVIDQNSDDRLGPILQRWSGLAIERIRCRPVGVSAARNLGLAQLHNEELIAFPDDDCVYEPCTLENAVTVFTAHPDFDIVMGRLHLPEESHTSCPAFARSTTDRPTRFGILQAGGTPVQFFRRAAVERAGGFDPLLGPGSGTPWVSGEDSDYLMRAGGLCGMVVRSATIRVFHPAVDGSTPGYAAKAYGYGRGRIRIIAASIIHPLATCLFAAPAVRRFRWHLFRGRLLEACCPSLPATCP
jgi:glycosyltransferase involved in cell wall biosynthesis